MNMDMQSEGTRKLLNALSECNDKLRAFMYQLYLRHQGSRWTQGMVISGSLLNTIVAEEARGYERCLIPSVSLHLSSTRFIFFGIYLHWNADNWKIEGAVELNDEDKEDITEDLWRAPAKYTQNLDTVISYLIKITEELIRYGHSQNFHHHT